MRAHGGWCGGAVGDVVVSNVARCRTARGAQIFRAASYGDIFRASPLSSCSHNLSNFHQREIARDILEIYFFNRDDRFCRAEVLLSRSRNTIFIIQDCCVFIISFFIKMNRKMNMTKDVFVCLSNIVIFFFLLKWIGCLYLFK